MYPDFPDISPEKPSSPAGVKATVTRYQFGDGYSQRVANGLNSIKEGYNASWRYLTPVDKDTLNDFLIAQKGTEVFMFTPPFENTARKYTCAEWRFMPHAGGWFSGTATFVEEFDL